MFSGFYKFVCELLDQTESFPPDENIHERCPSLAVAGSDVSRPSSSSLVVCAADADALLRRRAQAAIAEQCLSTRRVALLPRPIHGASVRKQYFIVFDLDNTLVRGSIGSRRNAALIAQYRAAVEELYAAEVAVGGPKRNSSLLHFTGSTHEHIRGGGGGDGDEDSRQQYADALARYNAVVRCIASSSSGDRAVDGRAGVGGGGGAFNDAAFLVALLSRLSQRGHMLRIATFAHLSCDAFSAVDGRRYSPQSGTATTCSMVGALSRMGTPQHQPASAQSGVVVAAAPSPMLHPPSVALQPSAFPMPPPLPPPPQSSSFCAQTPTATAQQTHAAEGRGLLDRPPPLAITPPSVGGHRVGAALTGGSNTLSPLLRYQPQSDRGATRKGDLWGSDDDANSDGGADAKLANDAGTPPLGSRDRRDSQATPLVGASLGRGGRQKGGESHAPREGSFMSNGALIDCARANEERAEATGMGGGLGPALGSLLPSLHGIQPQHWHRSLVGGHRRNSHRRSPTVSFEGACDAAKRGAPLSLAADEEGPSRGAPLHHSGSPPPHSSLLCVSNSKSNSPPTLSGGGRSEHVVSCATVSNNNLLVGSMCTLSAQSASHYQQLAMLHGASVTSWCGGGGNSATLTLAVAGQSQPPSATAALGGGPAAGGPQLSVPQLAGGGISLGGSVDSGEGAGYLAVHTPIGLLGTGTHTVAGTPSAQGPPPHAVGPNVGEGGGAASALSPPLPVFEPVDGSSPSTAPSGGPPLPPSSADLAVPSPSVLGGAVNAIGRGAAAVGGGGFMCRMQSNSFDGRLVDRIQPVTGGRGVGGGFASATSSSCHYHHFVDSPSGHPLQSVAPLAAERCGGGEQAPRQHTGSGEAYGAPMLMMAGGGDDSPQSNDAFPLPELMGTVVSAMTVNTVGRAPLSLPSSAVDGGMQRPRHSSSSNTSFGGFSLGGGGPVHVAVSSAGKVGVDDSTTSGHSSQPRLATFATDMTNSSGAFPPPPLDNYSAAGGYAPIAAAAAGGLAADSAVAYSVLPMGANSSHTAHANDEGNRRTPMYASFVCGSLQEKDEGGGERGGGGSGERTPLAHRFGLAEGVDTSGGGGGMGAGGESTSFNSFGQHFHHSVAGGVPPPPTMVSASAHGDGVLKVRPSRRSGLAVSPPVAHAVRGIADDVVATTCHPSTHPHPATGDADAAISYTFDLPSSTPPLSAPIAAPPPPPLLLNRSSIGGGSGMVHSPSYLTMAEDDADDVPVIRPAVGYARALRMASCQPFAQGEGPSRGDANGDALATGTGAAAAADCFDELSYGYCVSPPSAIPTIANTSFVTPGSFGGCAEGGGLAGNHEATPCTVPSLAGPQDANTHRRSAFPAEPVLCQPPSAAASLPPLRPPIPPCVPPPTAAPAPPVNSAAAGRRHVGHDVLDLLDAIAPSRDYLLQGEHVLGWPKGRSRAGQGHGYGASPLGMLCPVNTSTASSNGGGGGGLPTGLMGGSVGIGKNAHIETLLRHEESQRGGGETSPDAIHPSQVVLIDDDYDNIAAALAQGYNAFQCPDGLTRGWYEGEIRLQHLLDLFAGSDF